jgi:hypothetical protein
VAATTFGTAQAGPVDLSRSQVSIFLMGSGTGISKISSSPLRAKKVAKRTFANLEILCCGSMLMLGVVIYANFRKIDCQKNLNKQF